MCGIKGRELGWFHDYMPDRSEVVNIRNYSSGQDPIYFTFTLFYIQFTLFYNDFVDHVSNSRVTKYVDDTVTDIAYKDVKKIAQCLNKDLHNISDYYRKNQQSA